MCRTTNKELRDIDKQFFFLLFLPKKLKESTILLQCLLNYKLYMYLFPDLYVYTMGILRKYIYVFLYVSTKSLYKLLKFCFR